MLFFPILICLLIGLIVGLLWIVMYIRARREDAEEKRSGFEVKLNSGGEPETKKKENDHG